MSMVRSQKSIGAAVGATSGNAPYSDGVLLRSAFGIALLVISSVRHLLALQTLTRAYEELRKSF
ncbi:hypothetical protein B1L04_15050 [Microcystis aeruginosa KW]|jgi:hypothetical protein|uniref:Uncharacterized protein n=1 Tax=Microcystis aeruginosa KW TaxID=1960155 RepID=A0A1V4BSD2_MICAE|nr:hypothetical protein B1L04_15050 [Microcystis aeruginosa KW]